MPTTPKYANPKYDGSRTKITRTLPSQRHQRQAIDRSIAASALMQNAAVVQSVPAMIAAVMLHITRQWKQVHGPERSNAAGTGASTRATTAICSIVRRRREPLVPGWKIPKYLGRPITNYHEDATP